MQKIERYLYSCLKAAHGNQLAHPAVKKIFKGDKATLGQLLAAMRRHVSLPDSFEQSLRELLRHRNILIHSLCFEDWFDLSTTAGRLRAIIFLDEIIHDSSIAIKIFVGYIIATYSEERGYTGDADLEVFLKKLASNTVPDYGGLRPDQYEDAFVQNVLREFAPHIKQITLDKALDSDPQ